ncbi:putative formate acetyltransferase 3 (pyruvate formate lyase 3) [Escherichia coli]|nr:putative formate acetyltransferase 3 (pyruvate formate lyase 3) [Escherichia coli]
MGLSLYRHELYQLRPRDAGALEGGRDATSGKVFLPQEKALSAGNFNNFDEVMDAWDTQIRYYTRKSIEIEYVVDTMLEENVHDILCSALVDDCIGASEKYQARRPRNMTGFLACRLALPTSATAWRP